MPRMAEETSVRILAPRSDSGWTDSYSTLLIIHLDFCGKLPPLHSTLLLRCAPPPLDVGVGHVSVPPSARRPLTSSDSQLCEHGERERKLLLTHRSSALSLSLPLSLLRSPFSRSKFDHFDLSHSYSSGARGEARWGTFSCGYTRVFAVGLESSV